MKKIVYILIGIFYPILLTSQVSTDSLYSIQNKSIQVVDEYLYVVFDAVIPAGTHLSTNEMLVITPALYTPQSSEATMTMPSIYVAGRTRRIVSERNGHYRNNVYDIIRRKNRQVQTIEYTIRLPFETWMEQSHIELLNSLEGCANCEKAFYATHLASIKSHDYEVQPIIAFILPPKEPVKMRALNGTAYLDFPVNQTVIHPDFMQNQSELSKIRKSIDIVKSDTNTHITGIQIIGYASPEGSYANNARLAQGRAESLKSYLLQHYSVITPQVIQVSSVPEDWEGLKQSVLKSSLHNKSQLLDIIDSNLEPDAKNWKIQVMDDGSTYRYLLEHVYPSLRHSDYTIHYRVNDFSLEQAKQVFQRAPHQLSLQELYLISESYPQGSDTFNQIFEVAVRMYPNDAIANANAAAIEIQKGNLDKALQYLNHADPNHPAILNNRGVIEMLHQRFDTAEALFIDAQAKGSTQAAGNLIELERKRSDMRHP